MIFTFAKNNQQNQSSSKIQKGQIIEIWIKMPAIQREIKSSGN
jgi:TusA-related sulfurtransferase